MKKAALLSSVVLLLFFAGSAFAAVKLPDKAPDIIGRTAQLDKAAVVIVTSIVSGTAVMPSYKVVQGAGAGGTATIVGTWQTAGETVSFTADGQFSGTSPQSGAFGGSYSIAGNVLTLNYTNPAAITVQFTFSVTASALVLSNPQIGTSTYSRVGAAPQPQSADVVENAKSLVLVREEGAEAKMLSREVQNGASGTGMIVSTDGYIVTNAHVVLQGRDPEQMLLQSLFSQFLNYLLADASQYYNIPEADKQKVVEIFFEKFLDYFQKNGSITNVSTSYYVLSGTAQPGEDLRAKSWPATVKKMGTMLETVGGQETWGKDVAIIKVEQKDLPTVKLGDSDKAQVGDRVFVIGYPGISQVIESILKPSSLLEATVTQGVISAKRQLPTGVEALQTDAAINHGNSGGPVYNDSGEVIGIATFITGERENIQGIGFLLPINIAKEFLNEINVQNKRGVIDEKYKKGLEAFWRKDCVTTMRELKSVLTINPAHPFAKDYINECERAIEAGEVSTGADIFSVTIAIVILAVIGAGYFFIRSKKIFTASTAAPQKKAEEKRAEETKYCSNCGAKISAGEKFCSGCGAKLK